MRRTLEVSRQCFAPSNFRIEVRFVSQLATCAENGWGTWRSQIVRTVGGRPDGIDRLTHTQVDRLVGHSSERLVLEGLFLRSERVQRDAPDHPDRSNR